MEMGDLHDGSKCPAFEKDPLELGVEDVYDISYIIGKDLLKLSRGGQEVSDLQFKIVRVLEMFEIMVSKYNLSMEELRMERDNLKGELDRIAAGSHENGNNVSVWRDQTIGLITSHKLTRLNGPMKVILKTTVSKVNETLFKKINLKNAVLLQCLSNSTAYLFF